MRSTQIKQSKKFQVLLHLLHFDTTQQMSLLDCQYLIFNHITKEFLILRLTFNK